MSDADRCAEITKHHARTFTLAAALLPREKRRGAFAFYAFCRQADDIVDGESADREEQLARYRCELDRTLAGRPATEVFRELSWSVAHFGVPREPLYELLDGIATDLHPERYATWDALQRYCASVASSVGEMCTFVFGVEAGGARALECALQRARYLGLAMQLTNILRDVGEDSARGRCYLPDDDLAQFGFSREDVLGNPRIASGSRWRNLMQFEIARARTLYTAAEPGVGLLARDAQQCASACARGYAAILDAIESQAYDTIRTRAVVPPWRKAGVLWRAWRLRTA
jgi:phytoene synthase